jgi:hypothetical protein
MESRSEKRKLTADHDASILLPPNPMANDQVPTTQADLRRLEASLIERIDTKSNRLHESIDQVLAVLVNMDKRLVSMDKRLVNMDNRLATGLDDHESRILHLENRVGV